MKSKNLLTPLLLILISLTGVLCQGKKAAGAQMNNLSKDESQLPVQDSLVVMSYAIHRVKLPTEHIVTDAKGNKASYELAWLVMLELKNMPKAPAQRIDFAIGEYVVPEYGGWEKGIYFRVYDDDIMSGLNNQAISYRLSPGDKMIISRITLMVPTDKNLKLEDENDLLGRKN